MSEQENADIVERWYKDQEAMTEQEPRADVVLRLKAAMDDGLNPCKHDMATLVEDAADEIERLRAEVKSLGGSAIHVSEVADWPVEKD